MVNETFTIVTLRYVMLRYVMSAYEICWRSLLYDFARA